jgi:curved DNA-binding protein CbpA
MATDPYEVLGLERGAGEADVRRRYLELVRQYPPDRAGGQFAEIHRAYEALRDPAARLESQLFSLEQGDGMAGILADCRRRLRRARLPTQLLLSLGEPR